MIVNFRDSELSSVCLNDNDSIWKQIELCHRFLFFECLEHGAGSLYSGVQLLRFPAAAEGAASSSCVAACRGCQVRGPEVAARGQVHGQFTQDLRLRFLDIEARASHIWVATLEWTRLRSFVPGFDFSPSSSYLQSICVVSDMVLFGPNGKCVLATDLNQILVKKTLLAAQRAYLSQYLKGMREPTTRGN